MSLYILGYDPGSVHRWAALLKFGGTKPQLIAVYEVPESREGVKLVLQQANANRDGEVVVAVERPKGVAYGNDAAQVKGKGKNLLETMNAAERFASIAWTRGHRVIEMTAAEVRAIFCHDKSASDSMVRKSVEANVIGRVTEGAEHVQDAEAIAVVVGVKLTKYRIVYPTALFKAKAKRASRKTTTKLAPSVRKAMEEQGLL